MLSDLGHLPFLESSAETAELFNQFVVAQENEYE